MQENYSTNQHTRPNENNDTTVANTKQNHVNGTTESVTNEQILIKYNEIIKQNEKIQGSYLELKTSTDILDDKINNKDGLTKKVKDLKIKIEESQNANLALLGIMIGFFTFVSIQFQFFNKFTDVIQYLAFTLTFSGVILLFIFANIALLNRKDETSITISGKKKITKTNFLLLTSIILISLGIISFIFNNNTNLKTNSSEQNTPNQQKFENKEVIIINPYNQNLESNPNQPRNQ